MAAFFNTMEQKKNIILFHGDFDGIISALFIIKHYSLQKPLLYVTEPFTIDKTYKKLLEINIAERGMLYLVDVAPNNKNMKMTIDFYNQISLQYPSVVMFDHHNGWEQVNFEKNCRVMVDKNAPSCAGFLFKTFEFSKCGFDSNEAEKLKRLADDADIIDSGGADGLSPDGELIYKALKADLKNENLRIEMLEYLLNTLQGHKNLKTYEKFSGLARDYEKILEYSYGLIKNLKELRHGICFLNVGSAPCDITSIMRKCYEKYKIVIIEYTAAGGQFYVIGTSEPQINLLEILKLKSGAKFRATINKKNIDEVLKLFDEYFEGIK